VGNARRVDLGSASRMLLLAALSLSVLSQATETRSPIAVVISSKRANAEAYSPKLATKVLEALRKEGIGPLLDDASANRELKQAGVTDPKSCAGSRSCVAKLAVLFGPRAVVIGIDVGKISKSLAIHIDAMAADAEEPLATIDFVAPADMWAEKSNAPLAQLMSQLKEKLVIKRTAVATVTPPVQVEPKTLQPDAPVRTDLQPKASSRPTAPSLVTTKTKRPKIGAWVLAGSAVATAAVAGTFAGLGFADKAAFDSARIDLGNGMSGSRLTQQQATGLAGSANTKLTVALTSAIVSAALGGVSVVLFTRE